jgi:hypothetical protein
LPLAAIYKSLHSQLSIFNFQFARVLLAELRLLLSDIRWWWYAVMAALIIAGLLAPVDVARPDRQTMHNNMNA